MSSLPRGGPTSACPRRRSGGAIQEADDQGEELKLPRASRPDLGVNEAILKRVPEVHVVEVVLLAHRRPHCPGVLADGVA